MRYVWWEGKTVRCRSLPALERVLTSSRLEFAVSSVVLLSSSPVRHLRAVPLAPNKRNGLDYLLLIFMLNPL